VHGQVQQVGRGDGAALPGEAADHLRAVREGGHLLGVRGVPRGEDDLIERRQPDLVAVVGAGAERDAGDAAAVGQQPEAVHGLRAASATSSGVLSNGPLPVMATVAR
jgi:hypothetical protein